MQSIENVMKTEPLDANVTVRQPQPLTKASRNTIARRSRSWDRSMSGMVTERLFSHEWIGEIDIIVQTECGVKVARGKEPAAKVFKTYYKTARMYMELESKASAEMYINKTRNVMVQEICKPRPEKSSELLVMLFTCACIDVLELRLRTHKRTIALERIKTWLEHADQLIRNNTTGVIAEIVQACKLQMCLLQMEKSLII